MTQPPHPGFGQPGPQQTVPTSMLRFTVQAGSVMGPLALTVLIDGRLARANRFGTTSIPIHPGPHRIEAYVPGLTQSGRASCDVMVAPNTVVEVFYAPPYSALAPGRLGLVEQQRQGLAGLILITAAAGLLLLICVVIFIVSLLS